MCVDLFEKREWGEGEGGGIVILDSTTINQIVFFLKKGGKKQFSLSRDKEVLKQKYWQVVCRTNCNTFNCHKIIRSFFFSFSNKWSKNFSRFHTLWGILVTFYLNWKFFFFFNNRNIVASTLCREYCHITLVHYWLSSFVLTYTGYPIIN